MSGPRDISVSLPQLKKIYTDIGGEKGLSEILYDFYERMSQDILIGFFFDGKDLAAIAQMQKQFLMRAMGGATSYAGKPPAQAHLALAPILSGHFDRRLRILEETLRDHHVGEDDIQAWVNFESAFRDSVQAK